MTINKSALVSTTDHIEYIPSNNQNKFKTLKKNHFKIQMLGPNGADMQIKRDSKSVTRDSVNLPDL